ncbi:LysR family transcriptional regulator [Pseudomonas synxantha]|uniref:LysR family transcriptional regulator n=1 Tax=Pseudomonas libanensis TaxID=75588 RepID=A0ABR5M8U6_9PSED|nr:LysR family transcriptional regulator [Pseudomonas synxantha]KPG75360.1 LysR family transcriptional regulator [Pseudomonas libanensis]KRA06440.1 LysR family transcriptional regulator [Pseudomonas sp. Root569]
MEIRHLRYFLEISDMGSFTAAAQRLGVAQPSLTRQMHALEEHVGCKLFTRSWQGACLTEAGEVLQKEARLTVSQFNSAIKRTQDKGKQVHRLVLGMIPGTEDELMGRVSTALGPEMKGIAVDVQSKLPLDLISALQQQSIEAAFIRRGDVPIEWVSQVIRKETLTAILPRGHHLLRKRMISARDLSGERLVVISAKAAPALRSTIDAFLAPYKTDLIVPLEADGMLSIFSMVTATGLCSLVPDSFCKMLPKNIATRRLGAIYDSALDLVLAHTGTSVSPLLERLFERIGDCKQP